MNSNNILDLLKKLTYPFDSNKYISGAFLIILLVNTHYFIPRPLLPNILIKELKKYGLLSFIFTLLLTYLLTKDIIVSIIVSLLIFALNYINLKMERFKDTDDVPLLINKYNYNLDRVIDKDVMRYSNKLGFIKADQSKIIPDNKPSLPPIINISSNNKCPKSNKKIKKQISHDIDNFKFNEDNLKYLQYDSQKK